MPRIARFIFTGDDDDQAEADRQTASLAGMAVALLLVVIGLFLFHKLHVRTMVEDCILSGRTNCDVVVARSR